MPSPAIQNKRQRSESFPVGAILALVGGFLDAYTYVSRGGVFANAQTGNMVLLGLRLADGRWSEALYYLLPIIAFAAGVILAERVQSALKYARAVHWRQIVILLELALLSGIGFVPVGACNPYVNVAVSFVCALQVESFRTLHGLAFATTMCTGNLRSGTELLFRYLRERNKSLLKSSLKYYGIIAVFILGAVTGMFATNAFAERAVWIPASLLLLVLILLHRREPETF
jgi:uncharacterized membrane protein YoaK (UPF0700 family)